MCGPLAKCKAAWEPTNRKECNWNGGTRTAHASRSLAPCLVPISSVGDTLTVDFAFTTVERHSFVSNLIELRFPTAPNDPNDPNDPKKN